MSPCVFWACVQRRLRPSPSLWLPLRLLFTFSEGIYFLHSSTPHFLKPSLALSPRLTPLFLLFIPLDSRVDSCVVCVCVSWLAEKCHQCCFFCSLALYFSKSLIAWSLIQLKLQHLSLWGVACRSVPFSRYPGTAAPLSLCVCVSSCFTQTLLPSSIVETRRQKGEKKKTADSPPSSFAC